MNSWQKWVKYAGDCLCLLELCWRYAGDALPKWGGTETLIRSVATFLTKRCIACKLDVSQKWGLRRYFNTYGFFGMLPMIQKCVRVLLIICYIQAAEYIEKYSDPRWGKSLIYRNSSGMYCIILHWFLGTCLLELSFSCNTESKEEMTKGSRSRFHLPVGFRGSTFPISLKTENQIKIWLSD